MTPSPLRQWESFHECFRKFVVSEVAVSEVQVAVLSELTDKMTTTTTQHDCEYKLTSQLTHGVWAWLKACYTPKVRDAPKQTQGRTPGRQTTTLDLSAHLSSSLSATPSTHRKSKCLTYPSLVFLATDSPNCGRWGDKGWFWPSHIRGTFGGRLLRHRHAACNVTALDPDQFIPWRHRPWPPGRVSACYLCGAGSRVSFVLVHATQGADSWQISTAVWRKVSISCPAPGMKVDRTLQLALQPAPDAATFLYTMHRRVYININRISTTTNSKKMSSACKTESKGTAVQFIWSIDDFTPTLAQACSQGHHRRQLGSKVDRQTAHRCGKTTQQPSWELGYLQGGAGMHTYLMIGKRKCVKISAPIGGMCLHQNAEVEEYIKLGLFIFWHKCSMIVVVVVFSHGVSLDHT